jgi:hypothetical protein
VAQLLLREADLDAPAVAVGHRRHAARGGPAQDPEAKEPLMPVAGV